MLFKQKDIATITRRISCIVMKPSKKVPLHQKQQADQAGQLQALKGVQLRKKMAATNSKQIRSSTKREPFHEKRQADQAGQ